MDKQILVVDDDDAIRALLRTVFRRRGFRVDVARNGLEAVEQMNARPYALVVLDLMMPVMSGYEVLDHLRRQSFMTRPRVIVLTAGLEPRPFAAELVIAALRKPFDIDLLIDTVTGCLATAEEIAAAGGETAAVAVTPDTRLN